MKSYFNENLNEDTRYYASITKIKWFLAKYRNTIFKPLITFSRKYQEIQWIAKLKGESEYSCIILDEYR